MESTYEIVRSEAGTILARLRRTKKFVSEYDRNGVLIYVVDNFSLPPEEYVKLKAKDYATLPIVSVA